MRDREPPKPREITFDVAYLLAEIEELKRIAEGRGLGTLAYILECAAIEARWQVQQLREEGSEPPRRK
jgi:hypothetical protein